MKNTSIALIALLGLLLGFIPQQPARAVPAAPVGGLPAPSAPALAAGVTDALAWLTARQSADGFWASGPAGLRIRDTAAAVLAYALSSQRPPAMQRGAAWLAGAPALETDLRTRAIVAQTQAGWSSSAERAALAARQAADGSWGDDAFVGQGNPFDTALVLQALAADPEPDRAQIQRAFAYLQSQRQADGSWRLSSERSTVRVTAGVLEGIGAFRRFFNVTTLVNPAIASLHTKQKPNGSFGDGPTGTVEETALALLGLWAAGDPNQAVLDAARAYLLAAQAGNGSWENNAYVTALAVQALSQRTATAWTGQIIDTYNGLNRPVQGATIRLSLPTGDLTATSDADGRFTLPNVPPGVHEFSVSKIGYAGSAITAPAVAGQTIDLGQVPITLIATVADFSWSPNPVQRGQTVGFTSASVPAVGRTVVTYLWQTSVDNYSTRGTNNTWSFQFNEIGEHSVRLTIVDSGGEVSTITKTIEVASPPPISGDPNQRPQISPSVPYGACLRQEGGQCDFSIFVNIRDGSSQHGSLWDWGDGTVEDAYYTSNFRQHRYEDEGVYPISIAVMTSNGMTATLTVPFTVTNVAPTADAGPDRTVTTGEAVDLFGSAADPGLRDAEQLTMAWDFGTGATATPAVINRSGHAATASVRYAWAVPGAYTVTLTARDPDGGVTVDQATYTVQNGNRAPTVTSRALALTLVNILYSYQLVASDPDGDALTYTLLQAPPGMTVSAAGQVTWTPSASQRGFFALKVKVADPTTGFAIHDFNVTVLEGSYASDLLVEAVGTNAVATHPQQLTVSGTVTATIRNVGFISATLPYSVTFFEDTNQDQTWTPGVDTVVGTTRVTAALAPMQTRTVQAPVSGSLLFRDNILYAYADSSREIDEAGREANNIARSGADGNRYTPPIGTFAPAIKWAWKGIKTKSFNALKTPAVGPFIDTNGDGLVDERDTPVIAFVGYEENPPAPSQLIVLRGDTGEVACAVPLTAHDYDNPMVVLGDLESDGKPELVVVSPNDAPAGSPLQAVAQAYRNDCTRIWRTNLPDTGCGYNVYNATVIVADLEGDRRAEVIAGRTLLNFDGSIRWSKTFAGGQCFPRAADLDLDGSLEVVYGQGSFRADGQPFYSPQSHSDQYSGQTALANFDADPAPEMVGFGQPINLSAPYAIRLFDDNHSVLWSVNAGSYYGTAPTLADVNLDGTPDVLITVSPDSTLLALNGRNGATLWSRYFPTSTGSSNGVSAFDFDGDGTLEIAYRDEGKVYLLRGADGQTLWAAENTSGTGFEYPVIADLDLDGHAEFVILGSSYDSSDYGRVTVYKDYYNSWRPARSVWNQEEYIPSYVADDGSIPVQSVPYWYRYNQTRTQVAPEGRDPAATPDLTASLITAGAAACPARFDLRVRVGNGGASAAPAGVRVAFYRSSVATANLIGTATTSRRLEPGNFEDVSVAWTAPPASSQTVFAVVNDQIVSTNVPEGRTGNNTHSRTVLPCAPGNQPPVFTTTPAATAFVGEPYRYPAAASDPNGDPISFGLGAAPALSSLGSVSGVLQWAPVEADLGTHGIVLTADDGRGGVTTQAFTLTVALPTPGGTVPPVCTTPGGTPGAPEIPGNGIDDDCNPATPDTIPAGALTAQVSTSQRSYPSHATAVILGSVRNVHPSLTLSGLTVTLAASGGAASGEIALPPLAPGTEYPVSLAFDTATVAPGAYTASLTARVGTATAASASSPFSILDSGAAGVALRGDLIIQTSQITVSLGQPITTTWQVRNVGNTDLSNVRIQVRVVDPATGTVRGTAFQTITLARNAQQQGTIIIPIVLHSGPALVVLTGTVGTVEQSLDSEGVILVGNVERRFLPLILR